MMTLYAAIGSAQMTKNAFGGEVPVIWKAGKEYGVGWQEFLIWCGLIWNILSYDELKQEYERKVAASGLPSEFSFDHYLERMVSRGLIASGTGYTGEAALYELLGGLFVSPIANNLTQRLRSVLRLLAAGKLSVPAAFEKVRGPKLEDTQRAVWRLIRQQELSTAELIQCVEKGVHKLQNGSDVVKGIYDSDGVNYRNVKVFSRFADLKGTILEAVANLYLNQQVYLETSCVGEAC